MAFYNRNAHLQAKLYGYDDYDVHDDVLADVSDVDADSCDDARPEGESSALDSK